MSFRNTVVKYAHASFDYVIVFLLHCVIAFCYYMAKDSYRKTAYQHKAY